MHSIDILLPTISECALALSETVEPYITEDNLPTLELDNLIRLQCRLDDAVGVIDLLQKVIKTEITARVKGLTGQSYEVPLDRSELGYARDHDRENADSNEVRRGGGKGFDQD